MSKNKLRIGFTACFFHPDQTRPIFKGKTLLYLEQSISNWLMNHGALAYLIPSPCGKVTLGDILDDVDGIILQGGADISPKNYQEEAMKPEWSGDQIRDQYEMAVIREAIPRDKPILGICRGAQLINVAFGGKLYQDIQTQNPHAQVHRDGEKYDQLFHPIDFEPGSLLERLYEKSAGAKVNSVHHQAVKELGNRVVVEARSAPDQLIEAVRYDSPDRFIYGMQWHPEFHRADDKTLLDPAPLMEYFLEEVKKRKR